MATMRKDGYRAIQQRGHPRADKQGRVLEHIVVVERALGKMLPATAVVHHVDGDKSNNTNGNLVVLESQSEHMALHRRHRTLRKGGDPWKPVRSHHKRKEVNWRDVAILCGDLGL